MGCGASGGEAADQDDSSGDQRPPPANGGFAARSADVLAGPPPSAPFNPKIATCSFLQLHAPNGQTWAKYCGSVPPVVRRGRLKGAWYECVYASCVFELTHPGWGDCAEFADNGPTGYVIEYAKACGHGDHAQAMESCEEFSRKELQKPPVEGSSRFLQHLARNGQTWQGYLKSSKVELDAQGFVRGAWGECITAACIFEAENPAWQELGPYSADGPAGQVVNFLEATGNGSYAGGLGKTEKATHEALARGSKVPVFDASFYQASSGIKPAAAVHVVDDPPAKPSGRKKALLVGCNYPGSKAQLNGCCNDVQRWWGVLQNLYGFKKEDLLILTDQNQKDWRKTSTRENLVNGIRWLVEGASEGDVLFFQFSGHGGQRPCLDGSEADGKDELLIPSDYEKNGVLVDHELFDLMVVPLQSGVKLTVILDCCHSGSALDLPFTWNERNGTWDTDRQPWHTAGDVQMFSGCEDAQCSMDVTVRGKAAGAMTTAMCDVLEQQASSKLQYPAMLQELLSILQARKYDQKPKLSSSQPFKPESKLFTLAEGHVKNLNPMLGQKSRPSKPPRANASGFAW